MHKLILMPTISDIQKGWAAKLDDELPGYTVVKVDDDSAMTEIEDADAAFGYVPGDLLKRATKLKWIQAHHAAPPPGFYYDDLTHSSVTVCLLYTSPSPRD